MIHYRLTTEQGDVEVWLGAAGRDELAPLVIEGAEEAVRLVDWIHRALDDRGHALGNETTPAKLRWAMRDRSAQRHRAQIVEDDVAW